MGKNLLLYFVPLLICALLVPLVKIIAWKLGIFAIEDKRTVHHGKIPRVGGIAVFLAFIIVVCIYMKPTQLLKGVMIGGFVVFVGGLLDDMYNLKAWQKLVFQCAGAIIAMEVGGIDIGRITLPFGIVIPQSFFSDVIIFGWIIGITNAINLIDGLDGLSSGFSIIILFTICLLTTINGKKDVLQLSLMLAGATSGFLLYNFHPASIFIGDCGAQFLGFMIAAISLRGFKGGTAITLMIPIILLFIPIMDVFSAIARRKLTGMKFSDPDKSHFHHQMMKLFNNDQTKAVLTIYAITTLFGFAAYIYAVNEKVGFVVLVVLLLAYDIFAEYTGMISKNYHPLLSLLKKLKGTENN